MVHFLILGSRADHVAQQLLSFHPMTASRMVPNYRGINI